MCQLLFFILFQYSHCIFRKKITAINLGCDISEENTVVCKCSCLVVYRGRIVIIVLNEAPEYKGNRVLVGISHLENSVECL